MDAVCPPSTEFKSSQFILGKHRNTYRCFKDAIRRASIVLKVCFCYTVIKLDIFMSLCHHDVPFPAILESIANKTVDRVLIENMIGY